MKERGRLDRLIARYVEHHVLTGERLDPVELCADEPQLLEEVREHIRCYERLDETMAQRVARTPRPTPDAQLPSFEGFRTIERVGWGGGGDVYKLEDLALGRTVAAKVVRPDSSLRSTIEDFLREARSLALFDDERFVRLYEFRPEADPPVLLMEYVEGFELGRIGHSLEYSQRARIVAEIAEAIHRAHTLGIQHRDLKPGNVLLDAGLAPKILDFGLSSGDPDRGHGRGTPAYMAPEQLDPGEPIDARTDVYALGVMLYELLCGAQPYTGATQQELIDAVREGTPPLPMEIQSDVPEPLQAIALKAMECRPQDRHATAREMALDLRRWLDGKPVLARPTLYRSTLEQRLRPHLDQVREWLRVKLIYRHEAERLEAAYRSLEAREDDWIFQARNLALSQVVLYLGAFLLVGGSLLYFAAYAYDAVEGLILPALVLALPFVGLNAAAHALDRRRRRVVAVAFYLGAVVLLPLFLLIFFEEVGWWPADADGERELFGGLFASNRQLQVASLVACAWSGWLAWTTRTFAMGSCFTLLAFVFHLALLSDFGLRPWLEDGRWDLLALHLGPFLLAAVILGRVMELRVRPWFTLPLYVTGALLYVLVLELMALDGRAFHYIGISMQPFQASDVSRPELLDSMTAMTLNGLMIYAAGRLLEQHGTELTRTSAWLLSSISPFAILHPISYLNHVGEYSRRFDWIYLGLALAMVLLSHYRQRRSFYYAGLIHTGGALWYITAHYEWFDEPWWSAAVVLVGLILLGAGLGLSARERRNR